RLKNYVSSEKELVDFVTLEQRQGRTQGWTDNSWSPRAIEDHGAPVSLPKLKKSL
ncbi:unnamed protein product, partial [Staurois parvus]